MRVLQTLMFFVFLIWVCSCRATAEGIQQYVFFNLDRAGIHDAAFLGNRAFAGAQIKYTWRQLEPREGVYDFRAIREDRAFLRAHGKALFVQLQDATFDPSLIGVPNYLRQDSRFHGGADPQYDIPGDDETRAVPAGWVARRWDPAVRERFRRLLAALGHEFDGKIAGINLPETAVEFGESGRLFPKGFTLEAYRQAVLVNMAALKRAFPHTVTMQYANFMPGEWLPDQDRGYLRSVYSEAKRLGVGVAGPDLLPYKKGQMRHSYPLIRGCHGRIPTGIAVQEGNYEYMNPKTGRQVTISELLTFAADYLRVGYVFWCTQEPYYSKTLIPFLRRSRGAGNKKPGVDNVRLLGRSALGAGPFQ